MGLKGRFCKTGRTYDKIDKIESSLSETKAKRRSVLAEKISGENIYKAPGICKAYGLKYSGSKIELNAVIKAYYDLDESFNEKLKTIYENVKWADGKYAPCQRSSRTGYSAGGFPGKSQVEPEKAAGAAVYGP